MYRLLILLLPLAPLGCGSRPELMDSGNDVRVTVESRVADCEYVGPVTSRVGANFQSYEDNVEYATNDVRNQAGKRGATHVVLTAPIKDSMASWGSLGSGDCNNCVALTGQAYRCGGSSSYEENPAASLPPTMGTERGKCYPNQTCNDGFVCLSDLCVRPPPPPE